MTHKRNRIPLGFIASSNQSFDGYGNYFVDIVEQNDFPDRPEMDAVPLFAQVTQDPVYDAKEVALDKILEKIISQPLESQGEVIRSQVCCHGLRTLRSIKPVDIDRECCKILSQYAHANWT